MSQRISDEFKDLFGQCDFVGSLDFCDDFSEQLSAFKLVDSLQFGMPPRIEMLRISDKVLNRDFVCKPLTDFLASLLVPQMRL